MRLAVFQRQVHSMHPLITAEGKRKRDFVLAAGKNSVQLFKKEIVIVLLSFAMTYIQIKVSLVVLCSFL